MRTANKVANDILLASVKGGATGGEEIARIFEKEIRSYGEEVREAAAEIMERFDRGGDEDEEWTAKEVAHEIRSLPLP